MDYRVTPARSLRSLRGGPVMTGCNCGAACSIQHLDTAPHVCLYSYHPSMRAEAGSGLVLGKGAALAPRGVDAAAKAGASPARAVREAPGNRPRVRKPAAFAAGRGTGLGEGDPRPRHACGALRQAATPRDRPASEAAAVTGTRKRGPRVTNRRR
jgi:hypothetical protein